MSLVLLLKRRSGPVPGTAPTNVSVPTISGTTTEGNTLTTTTGTWAGSATITYGYQWLRGTTNDTNFQLISGATLSTYTLTNSDAGTHIRARVTASNSFGSAQATSISTATIAPASTPTPPSPTTRIGWRFVLCDLNGLARGELLAFERSLVFGISRPDTASFRIRGDDSLWSSTDPDQSLLKVYDSTGTLQFYGPIISTDESGSGQGSTVKVNAADLSWRLSKRIIGAPTQGGACPTGVSFSEVDSGQIAFSLLQMANAEKATGISTGLRETFLPRTVTYSFNKVLDAISELGAIAASYEWSLRYADGSPPGVFMDLESRIGGDVSSRVFFEYGTGQSNCSAFSRVRSTEQAANQIFIEGTDGANRVIVRVQDLPSQAGPLGLCQDYLTFTDIAVPDLLLALGEAHLAARKQARTIVQVTPFPKTSPRLGADWNLGDVVTLRVQSHGVMLVNGFARIWGAEIPIDELGNEQPNLQLVPD